MVTTLPLASSSTYAPAHTSGPPYLASVMRSTAHVVLEDAHARLRCDRLEQRALDLAPGHVGGVGDAARAVAALEVQVEVGVAVVAPRLGAGRTGRRCRCSIAMRAGPSLTQISTARSWQRPAPAMQRVRDVRLERVARAEHRGDAALGVLGVRLVGAALGDDEDVAVRRGLERERQARRPRCR